MRQLISQNTVVLVENFKLIVYFYQTVQEKSILHKPKSYEVAFVFC